MSAAPSRMRKTLRQLRRSTNPQHRRRAPEPSPPVAEPKAASATDALVEAPAFRIATDTLRTNALTDSEEAYIGTRDWR